ncbi:unnamed protein product [Tenebrio molitor]|nr:unnamed protein product [Tenebrio molitor]
MWFLVTNKRYHNHVKNLGCQLVVTIIKFYLYVIT